MPVAVQLWTVKLWRWFRSISLELATLLFMASVLMTYLLMQDFIIERVCRVNLGYAEEVCQAVIKNTGNYSTEETHIQKIMTNLRRDQSVIQYTIPVFFVLLQGSWSDIHGRKLALLLPCVGFFLQAASLYMSFYFEHWDGYTIIWLTTIPKCLAGSDVTFRMAALSYISDISFENSRTVRTGLISAAFSLGVPLGFALGGATVKASLSPKISFLISAAICMTAFLLIAIFVDNRPMLPKREGTSSSKKEGKKTKSFFTLSNLRSVLGSFILSFDGISTRTRIKIFVLLFAVVCINAPIQGEFGVMYLYLRKKLGWDLGDYGVFSTYVSLVGVVGTLLSMGLMCSLLKLRDPVIGFISGISQFGGCFMYAFAYTNFMLYLVCPVYLVLPCIIGIAVYLSPFSLHLLERFFSLAPTVDCLNGTMSVIAKSILSKLISADEYGKLFSLLAVIELLVPLVFDPTYSMLYQHTMESFPGAVFLLSAAMTIPPQLTYLYYMCKTRNSLSCEITEDGNGKSSASAEHKGKSAYLESSHNDPVALTSAISTSTVDTVVY